MSKIPGMPAQDYHLAVSMGFDLEETGYAWLKHTDWCRDHDVQFVGGEPWRRFLKARLGHKQAEAKRMEAEAAISGEARRSKEQADEAYAKQAVPFTSYLDSLTAKRGPLTVAEERLLEAGDPPEGSDIGAWVFGIVAGHPGAAPCPRQRECACGHPVKSWAHMGQRYDGSKCQGCIDIAIRNRERARQAHKQQGSGAT